MKYLKLYENKILDDILDKISDVGEQQLTPWEREYLAAFGTGKQDEMEAERNKENTEDVNYATPFNQEVGGDMDDYMQNMNDAAELLDQVENFWDTISDDEVEEFFDKFSVYGDFHTKKWDELPPELQELFIKYLVQKGYIER